MMDHDNAKEPLTAGFCQQACETFALFVADTARRQEWQGRDAGIDADQRDIAASPQIREADRAIGPVIQHEGPEAPLHRWQRLADISVVVARNDADHFGPAKCGGYRQRLWKFRRVADIDEIAGQRDVIRPLRNDISHDLVENIHIVDGGACTMPVHRPGQALVHQMADRNCRQWPDVGIREMRDEKGQSGDPERQGVALATIRSVSRDAGEASSADTLRENWISGLRRLLGRILHIWFFLSRGMTMGVRAVVIDGEGRVFLVRHSYVPGWHLPGGGIEHGQDALAALSMELHEEGNIETSGAPELFGIYFNTLASRRDHVLLYVVRDFRQTGPRLPDREIVECGFFQPHALPAGTTQATRRRLREVLEGEKPAPIW